MSAAHRHPTSATRIGRRPRRRRRPPPAAAAPHAGRRRRRPGRGRRLAEPVCAQLEHVSALGPLEQHLRRSGALAAIRGSRRRRSVHQRSLAARNRRTGASGPAPTMSAGAISAISANYERIGRFKINGLWDEIPQFYSVDTRTAFTSPGEGVLVLDDARTGGEEPQRLPPDLAAVRSARAARHRHRSRQRDADDTRRRHRRVHDDEALGRAAVGSELRVQRTTTKWRCLTDPGPTTWTSVRSGRTRAPMIRAAYNGSWFHNLDDTLTWDNPLQLTDTTSAPGHGRTALWPSNSAADAEHGGLRKARASHAAHRFAGLRLVEQRRRLCCRSPINSALPQFTLPRVDRGGRGPHRRDERQSRLASAGQLAVQRPVPALRLQQRDARNRHSAVHQLRHVGRRRARPVVRSSLRTAATRSTPKRRGPASSRWR